MYPVDGSVNTRSSSAVEVVTPAGNNCVGVVIALPHPIADELQQWRASFGDSLADVVPAHITLVTTTYYDDWDATIEHVRKVARQQTPFRVRIGGTGSFRPVSPVVYLKVSEGFDECVRLHERLQTGPLGRELPFAFHPHVTVAHDVSDESMDDAEHMLGSYAASFEIGTMGLYEHDNNGVWRLREELNFGSQSPEKDPG